MSSNKIKKLIACLLALSTLVLCACGNDAGKNDPKETTVEGKDDPKETTVEGKDDPKETTADNTAPAGDVSYEVTVLDHQGKRYTEGVIVKFLQDGKQVAMQPVGADGVAKKVLPKGNYSLDIVFTADNASAYFDAAKAVLSAEQVATTVTLYPRTSGEGVDLVADGVDYKAYPLLVGTTCVNIAKQTRNYFLFSPTEAGTYQFRVNNKDAKLGYYGSPYFVQSNSVAEVTDNTFTVSVSQSMIGTGGTGTTTLVVGVDGTDSDQECLLTVERIGDPEWSVENEPWTVYATTHTPAKFTLDLGGKTLTYVDITGTAADNQVVFGADGYYHYGTESGPVVYVDLGKKSPNVSLQAMIEGDGNMGGAALRRYFWNSDARDKESFIKKEDYTEIMRAYFANMDENLSVYPLTQDLVYIMQNACADWWNAASPNYILEGSNPEIGWMFALCYLA